MTYYIQIDDEVREATNEEVAQIELNAANAQAEEIDKQTKAAQKQLLFDRLGITQEEAQLLLGGN